MVGSIKIRLAEAEANDIVTQGPQFTGHTGHLKGFGFGEVLDTIRQHNEI